MDFDRESQLHSLPRETTDQPNALVTFASDPAETLTSEMSKVLHRDACVKNMAFVYIYYNKKSNSSISMHVRDISHTGRSLSTKVRICVFHCIDRNEG